MNTAEKINPVIGQLESVLDTGKVPAPYDRWGARLLAHLTKPVQVVVTGFAVTGKSALIEMLSAQPVIGHDLDVPMVELAYGEHERALIERGDGSVTSFAGCLKDFDIPADAVRARQELPVHSLMNQNFTEIGLIGDTDQKRATLETVIARADIILWCSQEFGEEEQYLWSLVPDQMKDHSSLVLTMADRQLMRGVLNDTIKQLEPVVAEEFLGLYPVATIQGITAQTLGDGVNEALWASSGGKYLMDQLNKQIVQGRMADNDRAQIFLERLAARMPQTTAQSAQPEITPLVPQTGLVAQQAQPVIPADAESSALFSDAVDLLQQHAGKMLESIDSSDEVDVDSVLTGCTEAIAQLSGLIETASDDDPAAQVVKDDVEEGEEMLMLFQLERGEEAALDAVTLLLQMRKELIEKAGTA